MTTTKTAMMTTTTTKTVMTITMMKLYLPKATYDFKCGKITQIYLICNQN